MDPRRNGSLKAAFTELAQGRLEALESVWATHARPLHSYAFAITGSQDEADDVLGQVMARLAGQGDKLARVREPEPYLFAMARNAARTWRRRARWWTPVKSPEDHAAEADPTDEVAVRQMVLGLPAEQREAVVLHVWGGLTFEEIGRVTHVSGNTAASRCRYALEKLRQCMRDDDE